MSTILFQSSRTFIKDLSTQLNPFNTEEAFMEFQPTDDFHDTITAEVNSYFSRNNAQTYKSVPGILRALSRIFVVLTFGEKIEGFGGWCFLKDGSLVAEYYDGSTAEYNRNIEKKNYEKERKILIHYSHKTGEAEAVCIDGNGSESPYEIDTVKKGGKKHSSSALIYALLVDQLFGQMTDPSDQIVQRILFNRLQRMLTAYSTREVYECAAAISSDFYNMIEHSAEVRKVMHWCGVPMNIASETLPMFDRTASLDLDEASQAGSLTSLASAKTNSGLAHVLSGSDRQTAVSDVAGQFAPDPNRVLSDTEKAMIPYEAVKDQMLGQYVELIARHIQVTSNLPTPFRNFILRGPAGTGKSNAVLQLSALCNLPYTFLTFDADMNKNELETNLLPKGDSSSEDSSDLKELMQRYPSMEEIYMDPEKSYEKITGTFKGAVNEQDVLTAMLDDLMHNVRSIGEQFMYVDSPLVEAARNGWIIDLQEPTLLLKPGMMGGLNALFDRTKTIKLMNGEVIHCHRDAVFVITTNVDYSGCRELNEAVNSRNCMFFDYDLPDDARLVKMVEQNSGYSDKKVIRKMIRVMKAVQKEMVANTGKDGGIGVRQIINWAVSTSITGDPYESGIHTVIHATSDREVQTILMNCLDSQFAPGGGANA